MALVSIGIVTGAIWLWVDLTFAWSEREPVKGRHAIAALILTIIIAGRIVQRLFAGTL